MSNNSILVTGASGFIGSHLIQSAKDDSIPFIGLSRSKENNNLNKVKNYLELDKYIKDDQVCVHLAGNNDIESIDTNEIKLLEYLADVYQSKLIYISSSYVYGSSYKLPILETDAISITNNYSSRKRDCENIVIRNSGVVLRLSNVYGPRMSNSIFNFIYNELIQKNNLIYIKNGFNIRDFINISDICSALLLLINNMKSGIYNLGTGKGTSIFDLCEMFASHLKIEKKSYEIISDSQDDTMIVLNSDKFKSDFLWEPIIKLNSGISAWINYSGNKI